jgi:hypothetical protein
VIYVLRVQIYTCYMQHIIHISLGNSIKHFKIQSDGQLILKANINVEITDTEQEF